MHTTDSSDQIFKAEHTPLEVWWITGSQYLYGAQVLDNVLAHTNTMVNYLNHSCLNAVKIKKIKVVATTEDINQICKEANHQSNCIGVIFWMHTFSPAKMWIEGLQVLQKPILHFHTQFNEKIPWEKIDMDFMNENQSAHGGREFGFLLSRMKKNRKIIVGHWKNGNTQEKLNDWCRVVKGWYTLKNTRVARIGDNMREVAVTEGNKVSAQIELGCKVESYGVGDLVAYVNQVNDKEIKSLINVYHQNYHVDKRILSHPSMIEAAKIEIGLENFLREHNANAFTTTFENLHGLNQLPGIAVQRLMHKGYGFGAEGDWKTAALLHTMKAMSHGLEGGTSFMEDYTYHFNQDQSLVLGSHMLEVCPSIASSMPSCEIHPLSIGGKADPLRLVFNVDEGQAINVSLIDLGNRFRVICNEVEVVAPTESMLKLPTARALWKPKPNFETGIEAWLKCGGAHHTVFSQSLKSKHIQDLCEMLDIEVITIDDSTKLSNLNYQLMTGELFYNSKIF
ncbi:L-arabinose isomerase [Aquimarina sp. U1-2]|uniref:L-arabinose isomerase n=1 Tax=Aquimarina sp. U1-2 TaxID=2823141 RepID=UPI001AECC660|nr:L-arabinose isomerase [Aquimarina sp. U1-2]MBP2832895.1 L-arabinose isomerase [Aquimarina sp. U1-2]